MITKFKCMYVQKYFDSSKPQGLLRRLHTLQFQAAQHGQVNVRSEQQHVASRLDLTYEKYAKITQGEFSNLEEKNAPSKTILAAMAAG
jgi:hypothetical protein